MLQEAYEYLVSTTTGFLIIIHLLRTLPERYELAIIFRLAIPNSQGISSKEFR